MGSFEKSVHELRYPFQQYGELELSKAMQATHKQKLEGSTFRGGVQMMVVYTQCCDEFVDDKKIGSYA